MQDSGGRVSRRYLAISICVKLKQKPSNDKQEIKFICSDVVARFFSFPPILIPLRMLCFRKERRNKLRLYEWRGLRSVMSVTSGGQLRRTGGSINPNPRLV